MTVDTKKLRAKVASSSPEMRRQAVMEMAGSFSNETMELLIEALDDEDWRVRKEASSVIARMAREPVVVSRLLEALEQEEVGLRNAAAQALVEAGEDSIQMTIDRLATMGASSRQLALDVLSNSKDERAIKALVEALEDADVNVRVCAAEGLGKQGGVAAEQGLLQCLLSSDRLIRLTVLQSLNGLECAIPWRLLEPLWEDKIYGDELVLALGRSGAKEAISLISSQLSQNPVAAARSE